MPIIIVYLSGSVSRCKVRETYDNVGAGDVPSGETLKYSPPKKSSDGLVYSSTTAKSLSSQRELRRYRFFGVRVYETEMVRSIPARLAIHIVEYQRQIAQISERDGRRLLGRRPFCAYTMHTVVRFALKHQHTLRPPRPSPQDRSQRGFPRCFVRIAHFALVIDLVGTGGCVPSQSFPLRYWLTPRAPPSSTQGRGNVA